MPFKRYNASNGQDFRTNYVGGDGELTWDSTNGLRLHDGSTSGGNPVGGSGVLTATDNDIEIRVTDNSADGDSIRQIISDSSSNYYASTQLQYDQFEINLDESGNVKQWRFEDTGEFRIPGNINTYDNDINIIAMNAGTAGNIYTAETSNARSSHSLLGQTSCP
jgi:hypothetical protein